MGPHDRELAPTRYPPNRAASVSSGPAASIRGRAMSRVVILGAGISGHTAASFLRKWLGKNDDVVVVSPLSHYNWIPSNIWVGVGLLKSEQVVFPLAPVYRSHGIEFKQARALALS